MRLRTFGILFLVAVMAVAVLACSAAAWHGESAAARHSGVSQRKADPISGEWDATFYSEGNSNSFALKLKFKLDGDKLTGTYESDHIGGGNISRGVWSANKIGFGIDSAHGSGLGVTGTLKDGKLFGEFDAGQMKGKWEAQKR